MSIVNDIVIMIPVYNPDEKFIKFVQELASEGYKKIIVIDDGSRNDTKYYFQEAVNSYGCDLVIHSINLGQGRAYKSGFNKYLSETGGYLDAIGIIQCDCDGQHHIEDVNECADLLRNNPDKFILGIRDFSKKSIPFRSRFGNKCTNFVFRFFCGIDVKDTQTGLKGIPTSFVPALMETFGERFEYASSVLLETKKQGVEILQYPIRTIYINGNETSHFNPLLDSIRIYSLLLKYMLSSLSAFIVDILIFSIFLTVTKGVMPSGYIVASTYLAKFISCTYSFMVNKRLIFGNKEKSLSIVVRYAVLCIVQSSASGFLTSVLVGWLLWNEVLCKMIIDTLLFFISYQGQDRWVFKRNVSKN